MTQDPMQLLRASNPVRDCDAPDFDRLLERLEHEPTDASVEDRPTPTLGRLLPLRVKKAPSVAAGSIRPLATGRRVLVPLLPVAVALAVATVAIVSLHGSPAGRTGPVRTTPATASLPDIPGEARGRVVLGSMHPFTVSASGAHNSTWGAEWFRTTAGQICVQAGRQVGRRLGYVDIDGLRPADGRFHPWAPNTAVDARCIDQPAHGGVALTVVERVADSGRALTASGACTAGAHARCPVSRTTTLYFGVLGSGAAMISYGPERHSTQSLQAGAPGADGEYVEAFPGCAGCAAVPAPTPQQLVHPGARAYAGYLGDGRTCVLRGPGTDGVLSGRCLYGLTLGPSPDRLTAAQVRTPVHITTKRSGNDVQVTARFRTRIASSRMAGYSVTISTPPSDCSGGRGASTASAITLGDQHFRAGAMVTQLGSAPVCRGTYHGAVVAQPLVGSSITVGRFSFKARPRR